MLNSPGYGHEFGGIAVHLTNNGETELDVTYFEMIPWYLRLYFNSLRVEINGTALDPLQSRSKYSRCKFNWTSLQTISFDPCRRPFISCNDWIFDFFAPTFRYRVNWHLMSRSHFFYGSIWQGIFALDRAPTRCTQRIRHWISRQEPSQTARWPSLSNYRPFSPKTRRFEM
jgi:hypothetical protein